MVKASDTVSATGASSTLANPEILEAVVKSFLSKIPPTWEPIQLYLPKEDKLQAMVDLLNFLDSKMFNLPVQVYLL